MIADVDVCNFYIHNMASRLLHQIARELCLMELPQWAIWLSMVRKCMNIPISSRSEMVMLPVGFAAEHSSSWMSSGHGMLCRGLGTRFRWRGGDCV